MVALSHYCCRTTLQCQCHISQATRHVRESIHRETLPGMSGISKNNGTPSGSLTETLGIEKKKKYKAEKSVKEFCEQKLSVILEIT